MCQIIFAHGPHTGRTSDSCGSFFCVDHRHHWLKIKKQAGPLSILEKAELLRKDKKQNELAQEALASLEQEGLA